MSDPQQVIRIKELLKTGMKPKAIVAEMGGGIKPEDVYPIAFQMRKDGELAKPTSGTKSNASKKTAASGKIKKGLDEFQTALANEIKAVEFEIDRLNVLAGSYDSTNAGFAIFIEKKIQKETVKLTALQEFEKN